ncbi:MAG: SPOR domain-containing protein [candidate division WOR-3 bacterium]
MKKDKFFFNLVFLSLFFLIFCKKNYLEEKRERKTEKPQEKYSYFAVTEKNFRIYDENFNLKKDFSFQIPIVDFSEIKEKIYVMTQDQKVVLFNKKTFSQDYQFSFIQNPTLSKIFSTERGFFYISKNRLIYKEKNKEETIISIDTNFVNIFKNPFQNFLYLVDEKGFLYSIDSSKRILKRRLFVGTILEIKFEKYGTRLIVVSPASTLILDYETLNIIDEIKDYFTNCFTFDKNPEFFLYSSADGRLFLYNGIDYSPEEKIEVKDKNSDIKSFNDSILVIYSKTKNTFDIFIKGKRVKKFHLDMDQKVEMIDLLVDKNIYLAGDSSILVYNIYTDSFKTYSVKEKIKKLELVSEEFEEKIEEKKITQLYTIQIYSLSNEVSAKSESERLKAKNPKDTVFVNDTMILDKKIYRVYLGIFDNMDDASIKRDELIKIGYGRDIVIKKLKVND